MQTLSAILTWSHNKLLFDKAASLDEYLWYAAQTIENGWSLSSLEYHVSSKTYHMDASIQPGNSGGPLLNSRGEVIGINTMTYSLVFALIERGYLPQNINYAVKIGYAIPAIKNVLANYGMQIPNGSGIAYPSVADTVAATERAVVLIIAK